MLATCCRCAFIASLVATPATAQSLSTADQIPQAPASPTGTFDSTAPEGSSSVSRFFTATLNDFKRLPSNENLILAGVGGLAAASVRPMDAGVTQGLSSSRQMGELFSPGEMLGSAAVQMAAAVATQVVGHASGNRRVFALGSDLVRAQIVTQSLTLGIKLSVQRTRPDGTQYSLPSGHASTTFATATVLQRHFGWKAGVPAYALATFVATSRVQVQRHYLTDVALGATLGIIAGRTVTLGRGDTRFALGPSVVPGGAGVNFTLVGRH